MATVEGDNRIELRARDRAKEHNFNGGTLSDAYDSNQLFSI